MKNFLFGHTDELTALIIKDYPYGFRLRTQIRYWIETTAKKGDRFCSQTMNPKTGNWNAPKKSTYSVLGVMFSDEKGDTHWSGLSPYDSQEKAKAFIEAIGGADKLNKEQHIQFNHVCGIHEIKEDEFTGEKKKDFSVKWERETIGQGWENGVWNKGEKGKCDEVRITFDRPDGVMIKEIFEAMKSLNQIRLSEVFEIRHSPTWGERTGTVRICTRGGMQLATVGEDEYKAYLASDTNILNAELGIN